MDKSPDLEFRFVVPRPPEGEVVELTSAQMEQRLLNQLEAAEDDPVDAMWQLAQFYKNEGQADRAREQFRLLLDRVTDHECRAQIVLALGQTAEKCRDYKMAVDIYRHALAHEPTDTGIWYFIHNNLGYSLNQLGQFVDGEQYCRAAIGIDPTRSNGHKNLGLSLQGQGRYHEAAQAFVAATQANASDPRSLGHLEALLKSHPELGFDFNHTLDCCRKAVAVAAEELAKLEAAWRPK